MKILIYGAGVLGSVLAVRLKEANQDVSIIARGDRYNFIRNNGIIIEDFWTKNRAKANVKVLDSLSEDEFYDLIIVVMPRICTPDILPILDKNKDSPNILFLGNNVTGFDEYSKIIDEKRLLIGFWLSSGRREEQIVYYSDINIKGEKARMIIGEKNGKISERTAFIKEAVEKAGIPLDISENIDAWLKTHAMLIAPFSLGSSKYDFDNYKLAKSDETIRLMSKAIKEGLTALRSLGIPVLPKDLNIIRFLPVFMMVMKYKSMLGSKYFEIASGHGKAAMDEMNYLAEECMKLIRKSNVKSPAFDILFNSRKLPITI